MNKIYLLPLFLVGLINFLPLIGLISLEKINKTYGLAVSSNDLEILLRHRALLFGVIGGFVFYSLFVPHYQSAAMALAAISMLGFMYLFHTVGEANDELFKIYKADILGLALLALSILLKYFVNDS